MRLIDILVIYLTIGAPVAALAVLKYPGRSRNAARSIFRFFWILASWPFFAVFEVWFFGNGQPQMSGIEDKPSPNLAAVQAVLSEINKRIIGQDPVLAPDHPVLVKSADLKESIAKYLELAMAVSALGVNERAAQHELNFYRASGSASQNAEISASCLHRRNMARFRIHWHRSKRELIFSLLAYAGAMTSTGTITARKTGTSHVLSVASGLLEVADRLGDRDLAVEVAAFLDCKFKDLARLETLDANDQRTEFIQPEAASGEVLIGIQR